MGGEGPLWREAASSSNRQTKNPRGTVTFSGRRVDAAATFPLVTGQLSSPPSGPLATATSEF